MQTIQTQIGADQQLSEQHVRYGTLVLEDGTTFEGRSFGYAAGQAGEVVFSTGMVGYPEALTDASFAGQILVLTYPLAGNYGVPEQQLWEDAHIHVSGLIVSQYIDTPSHAQSTMTLGQWLRQENVPALEIKDTRRLTQHIRTHGAMLGKIVFDEDIPFVDPNLENQIARVSTKHVSRAGQGTRTIALLDCGAKRNIVRCLLKRDIELVTLPWNYDPFASGSEIQFDGLIISNGPGDPKMAQQSIATVRTALENNIPTLGICMGNQILTLAAGGDTYKMKFGHRSQNQPCVMRNSQRCYITTQNHGFAVGDVPQGFEPWFVNANDNTNEGIRHTSKPFMSVQFHPEAAPGPVDTEWVFDYFLEQVGEAGEKVG